MRSWFDARGRRMLFKERFEWLARMALLVFILAAAAFLSAITAIRFAIHGREVDMPNVVGKTAADAQAMLTARGLRMKIADRVYSDLGVNQVVRQSPTAGVHMKVTQAAHVVLSLGRREVQIPQLEGKSLRSARLELLRTGLQLGEVSSAYLPDYTADTVVVQSPRPGTGAANPRVNVLVSQGPREPAYVMPFVVGLNHVDAQRQLAASGLRVEQTFVLAPEWPHGAVMEQTPADGARIGSGTSVQLHVAE